MSSSSLPAAALPSLPVSSAAAGFMKVMRPSLSVAMIASASELSASHCGSDAGSGAMRSAGCVCVGMISTPVISSALPLS